MLDIDTKRRIDTARDILVGKVPDPKSQVEQITIALIYKFMGDIDAESEELGGQRKFFAGEFARFGWAKLMRSGLGGHETLGLYAEAIGKMPENPGIPPLFRAIFSNAYLPYRDPETLREFLKIIDEFTYDHSERLGDAFEYLLSVLGSQGDAGQFRTPRHIIDFIVEIVDPKKTETVLDPACGTAGFLISSYKHILKANTDDNGHITLTPEEKGRIAQNFRGYDISPDMVRLSLVNLYLHGFNDPQIYEYDTLTSEERWNEYYDVILANPPFMSPKGGIKPHSRFSVQSKRSEVLFVDYMAEHLTSNGRAGIIVPEGIIFQSQTAYRDLRKLLVESSLIAVISLPAGVFNPYSGVKTSILILDKVLARQSDTIAFFKVENDGFGLGAQRREVEKNDLPQAKAELDTFLDSLRNQQRADDLSLTLGEIVSKEDIGRNGDYNLSRERYRKDAVLTATWPLVALGEVTKRVSGGTPSKEDSTFWNGSIPWVSPKDMKVAEIRDTVDHVTERAIHASAVSLVPPGTLLCVVRSGILKHSLPLALTMREVSFNQDIVALIPNHGRLDTRFLFYILRGRSAEILRKGIKPGVTVQSFYNGFFNDFEIPLPPLDVQKEIVAEFEGYQKVIDGAQSVLANYRPHIPINPNWPIISLGEISSFKNGLNFSRAESGYTAKIIGVRNFQSNLYAPLQDLDEVNLDGPLPDDYLVRGGDILFVRSNGNPQLVGRSLIVPRTNEPITFSGFTIRGRMTDERALPSFYAHFFKSRDFAEMIKTVGQGANIRNLSQRILENLKIPLPSIETQQRVVAEIEAEQALIAANRELIERFEKKIQATIARVWGDDKLTPTEA
jgi:type I restriction enzyme M protein